MNKELFEKSLKVRNEEAIQKIVDKEDLLEWSKSPYQSTLTQSETIKYREDMGRQFIKGKIRYV